MENIFGKMVRLILGAAGVLIYDDNRGAFYLRHILE